MQLGCGAAGMATAAPAAAELTAAGGAGPGMQRGSDVWLHVYHCGAVNGSLEPAVSEVGTFHVGVEVHGAEKGATSQWFSVKRSGEFVDVRLELLVPTNCTIAARGPQLLQ